MTPRKRRADRRTVWLSLLALAAVALFSVLVPLQAVFSGTVLPAAMILGAALCAAPLVAVSRPRTAVVAFCVAAFALPWSASPDRDPSWPWPWSVAATLAFVLMLLVLTIRHDWRWGVLTWSVSNAGALVLVWIFPDAVSVGAATANLIVTASVTAAALLVGVLIAARIRVGAELVRSRELTAQEQARRELVEERSRVARELHDVVAHSLSVIQVQASTARYRLPELPEPVASEFDDIAATARTSLAEMRHLLGVLRTEEDTAALSPVPRLSDIPALVDGVRRTGVRVSLTMEGVSEMVPSGVEVTGFRIVQEALSNAVRHAPGSAIEVSLRRGDDALAVRVHDSGSTEPRRDSPSPAVHAADPRRTAGHGLRGMHERVALLDGTLSAAADPAGGWTVAAVLPLARAAEEM
ncbi:sensor histidine kinase [Microbacterium sp. TNHR37B]|uniref:sensor histidine kinase n=1 Tax=Microbacterium sp. TNHR37B TaxID=1775956 RepID=UPI0007B266C0|nr:sensor histidine kinase [Microbacterium sp. TNHR37B]KZE90610.1 Sensor histidine kinase DesK [Microbacterium sp. TNHR37B]